MWQHLWNVTFGVLGVQYNSENWSNFIIAVVFAVAGVIGWSTNQFYSFAKLWVSKRRGVLTGVWTGVAISDDGAITKWDRYQVAQTGDAIYVRGIRKFPPTQQNYVWHLNGNWRERSVIGFFVSDDPKIHSMGVIYLVSNKEANVLDGYYITAKNITSSLHTNNATRATKYIWVRGDISMDVLENINTHDALMKYINKYN